MKKINLVLVLFFAWFVGLSSVFGICTAQREFPKLTSICDSPTLSIRNFTNYYGISDTSSSEYSDSYFSSEMEVIDNYNLFGYYSSDSFWPNQLISYKKPIHTDWENNYSLIFKHWQETGADPNGNVFWFEAYESTDYVLIDLGNFTSSVATPVNTLTRFDFSIHINFNSIPSDVKNSIYGGLLVDPVLFSGSSGQSYCASTYDFSNERINVSCSAIYDGSNVIVRILNNNKLNFKYSNSTYNYHCYFDISAFTEVHFFNTTASDFDSFNDFDTNSSPSGSTFDDYYDIVQKNSSWFNSINFDSLNGLTSVITAPLAFFNSLNFETLDDLEFSIFKTDISIPNGCSLFWCKTNRDFTNKYIGGKYYTRSQQYSAFNTFRILWRNLFGGFIIYLLAKKCVLVAFKCMSPDNSSVEVF